MIKSTSQNLGSTFYQNHVCIFFFQVIYLQNMKLIVGLGNPGKQYEKTRHNVGFMVLEQVLKDFEPTKQTIWNSSTKFKSDIAELEWQPQQGELQKLILVKPKTFMNNSGMAIQLLTNFYKISSEDIWVIHDDVDFPVGSMRIR